MVKLNFLHRYSSFQCHMILKKAFYADFVLKKNVFIIFFFRIQHLFEIALLTILLNQYNASLLDENINK